MSNFWKHPHTPVVIIGTFLGAVSAGLAIWTYYNDKEFKQVQKEIAALTLAKLKQDLQKAV